MGLFSKLKKIFSSEAKLNPVAEIPKLKIACVATYAEFLISELHRFKDENNRIPRAGDMKNIAGYPTQRNFANEFGSWNDALIAAGFKISMNKWSNDDIIIKIQHYVKEHGVIPTLNEFNATTEIPRGIYKERFGSWTKAIIAAGFEPTIYSKSAYSHFTDEEILAEIDRFVIENGHVPTSKEMNMFDNFPGLTIYIERFGSWNKALLKCGYNPIYSREPLNGNEECSVCGFKGRTTWRFINGKRVCTHCHRHMPNHRVTFGCEPINSYSPGHVFHHLHLKSDHSIGIYIPKELHQSIPHSSKSGYGMNEINEAAMQWYLDYQCKR